MRAVPMEWYLRSAGHADAHYGQMTDEGTVHACRGAAMHPDPARDLTRELVMGLAPGEPTAGPPAVYETESVLLVRYRHGVVGETARIVHVVTVLASEPVHVLSARCGAMLIPEKLEAVALGEGMPCLVCVLRCTSDADLK